MGLLFFTILFVPVLGDDVAAGGRRFVVVVVVVVYYPSVCSCS